ncbi:MAG: hypothetical protein DWQ36_20385 [Acidobacteria bacterium]|nr:MAG: hypothetical protein DWQ30_20810 [Acidobacteriota bacterium]REK03228.1 MAG: hypothetical protein DWQ36_20385 [Acidobacteriota bacterium]
MSSPYTDAFAHAPERTELLAALSQYLVRLEEITEAFRRAADANTAASLELPLRRLQSDLLDRSDFASWHSSQRMAHAYSLAVQEAAAHLDELRASDDPQEWLEHAALARQALQRAVVRVRRLDD